MNTHASAEFQNDYLSTWTEPDPDRRRRMIEKVWASDGELVISPLGVTLHGRADIAAHITGVHDDMIAAKRLTFSYDQQLAAGDAVLLRWSMTSPSGDIIGRGIDLVFHNAAGQLAKAYMFMGVN